MMAESLTDQSCCRYHENSYVSQLREPKLPDPLCAAYATVWYAAYLFAVPCGIDCLRWPRRYTDPAADHRADYCRYALC